MHKNNKKEASDKLLPHHYAFIVDQSLQGKSKTKIAIKLKKNAPEYFKNTTETALRHRVSRYVSSQKGKSEIAKRGYSPEADFTTGTKDTETNQYEEVTDLNAIRPDGKVMSVKEFCETYGLPFDEARSYKFISHNRGFATYNIASHVINEKEEGIGVNFEEVFKSVLDSLEAKPDLDYKRPVQSLRQGSEKSLQITFTDVHVGMSTEKGLFGGKWDSKSLEERRLMIVEKARELAKSHNPDYLQVRNLGDFADGWDGYTVRRGHNLPQNMDNTEVFEAGLKFLVDLYTDLRELSAKKEVIWYNVCNSNHSGDFDYIICQAFKAIVEAKFPDDKLHVINEKKFIGHYIWGNNIEVLTHGKDADNLKFGFKPHLDEKATKKIEEYLKFHGLFGHKGKRIFVSKGDSHLSVRDKTNPDFEYNSYLALSPSSAWVQTNFSAGRSGFCIDIKHKYKYEVSENEFEFEWDSNSLK